LIDRLVGEKSAARIAEDIFDHKLPNEVVSALADANDPEVVRAILAAGWDIGQIKLYHKTSATYPKNFVG
jgi:hypothetical protein